MVDARQRVVVVGIGGSGVVSVGTLIARAGLRRYRYVTGLPNYDTTMRGGPCEYMVTLSDYPIHTPLVSTGDALLILNSSRWEFLEKAVSPGGVIVLESTGLKDRVLRKDVQLLYVPALETAASMGDPLMSNMIILGAYIQLTGVFPPEFVESELEARFGVASGGTASSRREAVSDLNLSAFRRGAELARVQR